MNKLWCFEVNSVFFVFFELFYLGLKLFLVPLQVLQLLTKLCQSFLFGFLNRGVGSFAEDLKRLLVQIVFRTFKKRKGTFIVFFLGICFLEALLLLAIAFFEVNLPSDEVDVLFPDYLISVLFGIKLIMEENRPVISEVHLMKVIHVKLSHKTGESVMPVIPWQYHFFQSFLVEYADALEFCVPVDDFGILFGLSHDERYS